MAKSGVVEVVEVGRVQGPGHGLHLPGPGLVPSPGFATGGAVTPAAVPAVALMESVGAVTTAAVPADCWPPAAPLGAAAAPLGAGAGDACSAAAWLLVLIHHCWYRLLSCTFSAVPADKKKYLIKFQFKLN